jgi:hypothetical protein
VVVVAAKDHVFGANVDDAAARHRLLRVEQDVVKHLADLADIDFGRPEIVRHVDAGGHGRTGTCKVNGIHDELDRGSQAPYRNATLGEGQ